jgi:general secretion pathway protein J
MRAASSSGFTLLEILVALVVFGFLMIGLTEGMQFGLHARSVQTRAVDAVGALETTDRVLRTLIEQMDPGTDDHPATVTGSAHSLAFPTTLPNGETGIDARLIDAALGVDGAHRLVLRWTPRAHAVRLGPPPVPVENVLLTGVDHVDFAYWVIPRGGGAQWVGSWSDTSLPVLVRMHIVFAKGDRRHWPVMIMAPMRQTPPDS